jgi:hypothetical protein
MLTIQPDTGAPAERASRDCALQGDLPHVIALNFGDRPFPPGRVMCEFGAAREARRAYPMPRFRARGDSSLSEFVHDSRIAHG